MAVRFFALAPTHSVKARFCSIVMKVSTNTASRSSSATPIRLHWAMPSKYHSIHKNDLARAMVAQSEQAILAMAQGRS